MRNYEKKHVKVFSRHYSKSWEVIVTVEKLKSLLGFWLWKTSVWEFLKEKKLLGATWSVFNSWKESFNDELKLFHAFVFWWHFCHCTYNFFSELIKCFKTGELAKQYFGREKEDFVSLDDFFWIISFNLSSFWSIWG